MKIIESEIFKRFPEIVFGFSTKIGLNRGAPFWFNMSHSVTENRDEVNENRTAFLNALGLSLENFAWQKQVHGNEIKIVNSPGYQGESDALITDRQGIALGVFSADCTTIFLYDKNRKVIAAVHSGWRGTAKKILPKVLNLLTEKYSSSPYDLSAYIAPSISQKNYEVGAEVAERFAEKYLIEKSNGKFLLDVPAVNYDYLLEFGIPAENIERSKLCSYETEYLQSYRRDGKISGRATGVIMMRSDTNF